MYPSSDIIDKLKISHEKFEDPDFGPSAADEFGAISLYGSGTPNPAGEVDRFINFFLANFCDVFHAIIMHYDYYFTFYYLNLKDYSIHCKIWKD